MAYQQIQLSELVTLLQNRLDNPGFWSYEEYVTALNEGISLFQIATGRWRKRFVVTTKPNRCFYSLPDSIQLQVNGICQVLAPIRATFQGQPLGWCSFSDLDMTYPGWQAQNTSTPGAPGTPQMCGPAGVNLLFIWPADAAGNNELGLDCITNSPALVNPTDYVNLDETEITGLINYGEHRLALKRGGIFFARTLPLLQGFYRMLADRNSYLMNIGLFRSQIGADFARNYAPRRTTEGRSQPLVMGLR